MSENTNITNSLTEYDTLVQSDDFGCIYEAFTLQVEHWDSFDIFSRDVQMPDVTTWYENIVTGWSYGTPDVYTTELYTIGDIPEDMEAYNTEEMEDSERQELAYRVHTCVNNPHNDMRANRAGLVHVGSFTTDHRNGDHSYNEYLRSLASFLESIDYEDQISF